MVPAPPAARRITRSVFATVVATGALLPLLTAEAVAERLPIQRYTSAEGLAHDRVRCIVQDSKGFLWFCTARGLSRYDGARFVAFTADNGLPNPSVNDLLERRDGSFWIATNGGGVVVLSYRQVPERILAAPHFQTKPHFERIAVGELTRSNRVNALYEDHAGRVWAGTDGGLFVYSEGDEGTGFRQVPLDLPDHPDTSLQVWRFIEDRARTLWIATGWGIVRRLADGRTEHVSVRPTAATDVVYDLTMDSQGRVWAAHTTGVVSFSAAVPGKPLMADIRGTRGLPRGPISTVHAMPDGRLWAGSASSGTIAELNGHEVRTYGEANGLGEDPITAIRHDRDGNIWIGTIAGGVMRASRVGFTVYGTADGLGHYAATSILDAEDGGIYVATARNLIHRFDGRRFHAVRPNLPVHAGQTTRRTTGLLDSRGDFWTPASDGLYRFPPLSRLEDLARARPRAVYSVAHGLADNDVLSLFEDSRGDIWIGNWAPARNVLTRWDRRTETFYKYSDAQGLPAFSTPNFFAEDRYGAVWIGFREGHLIRYRSGKFDHIAVPGYVYGGIHQIHSDRSGRLWVMTANGAQRIDHPDADKPDFRTYTEAHGLATRYLIAVTEDRWGRIYFGSSIGVDRLDVASGRITQFTAADGLGRKEMIAAHADRQGNLWFVTYGGLIRFAPDPPREVAPAMTFIADVRVAGASVAGDDRGLREISGLRLRPSQNQVRIEYFGLSTSPDDTIRYQYRLHGADVNWSAATTDRIVTYAHLAPGHYRFLVRAIASGVPAPAVASVAFTVLPPIWQTWWFIVASLILMAAATYGLSRHRLTRQLELARIRARIATDLHDDVGSSLSQIAILSEVAQRNADGDAKIHDPLQKISATSRELVDTMSDIVWAINPERDSLRDLTYRMRRFASDTLTAAQIEFRFTASGTEDTTSVGADIRRDVYLMFKESLNNLVRHSRARFVEITFRVVRETLVLDVKDDGVGFEDDPENPGHGLRSLRRRAQALGGCVQIESACGAGTRLLFRIPVSRTALRTAPPE